MKGAGEAKRANLPPHAPSTALASREWGRCDDGGAHEPVPHKTVANMPADERRADLIGINRGGPHRIKFKRPKGAARAWTSDQRRRADARRKSQFPEPAGHLPAYPGRGHSPGNPYVMGLSGRRPGLQAQEAGPLSLPRLLDDCAAGGRLPRRVAAQSRACAGHLSGRFAAGGYRRWPLDRRSRNHGRLARLHEAARRAQHARAHHWRAACRDPAA